MVFIVGAGGPGGSRLPALAAVERHARRVRLNSDDVGNRTGESHGFPPCGRLTAFSGEELQARPVAPTVPASAEDSRNAMAAWPPPQRRHPVGSMRVRDSRSRVREFRLTGVSDPWASNEPGRPMASSGLRVKASRLAFRTCRSRPLASGARPVSAARRGLPRGHGRIWTLSAAILPASGSASITQSITHSLDSG